MLKNFWELGGVVNSAIHAIQIKLFSSEGSTRLIGGGGGKGVRSSRPWDLGGGGWY